MVNVIKLDGQKSVTANWYTDVCLPEGLSGLRVKGLMLHHDNASSHTANMTHEFLNRNKIKVIPHPPYSPDLALCDLWLFPELKRNLRGRKFSTEEEIDLAVYSYFDSIPKHE